jgi:hypothetical protein
MVINMLKFDIDFNGYLEKCSVLNDNFNRANFMAVLSQLNTLDEKTAGNRKSISRLIENTMSDVASAKFADKEEEQRELKYKMCELTVKALAENAKDDEALDLLTYFAIRLQNELADRLSRRYSEIMKAQEEKAAIRQ